MFFLQAATVKCMNSLYLCQYDVLHMYGLISFILFSSVDTSHVRDILSSCIVTCVLT